MTSARLLLACVFVLVCEQYFASATAYAGSARSSLGGGRSASSQSASREGSSSSSSSSSGSSDSDSSSSTTTVSSCVETSSVVGRRQCSRFAPWDVSRIPRFQVALGMSVHSFPMGGLGFDGSIADLGADFELAGAAASETGRASAVTLDLRATAMRGQHLYLGGEVSFGGVILPQTVLGPEVGLQLAPHGSMFLSGGPVVGVRAEVMGQTLRAEALFGGRLVGLSVEGRRTDATCQGSTTETATSAAFAGEWLVAPRVALDHWLSPWVTIGASVGANVLNARDYAVGFYFQVHPRAYDGTRRRAF